MYGRAGFALLRKRVPALLAARPSGVDTITKYTGQIQNSLAVDIVDGDVRRYTNMYETNRRPVNVGERRVQTT
jgi:hypothetical protein